MTLAFYVIYQRESLSIFSGGMICNLINTNQGGSFLPFMCRSVFHVQKFPNECPCSGVLYLMLHLEADILGSGSFLHFFWAIYIYIGGAQYIYIYWGGGHTDRLQLYSYLLYKWCRVRKTMPHTEASAVFKTIHVFKTQQGILNHSEL